jgi:hypothetical protein
MTFLPTHFIAPQPAGVRIFIPIETILIVATHRLANLIAILTTRIARILTTVIATAGITATRIATTRITAAGITATRIAATRINLAGITALAARILRRVGIA